MRILSTLSLLALVGCASAPYKPDRPAPTPEQMRALLDAPIKVAKPLKPITDLKLEAPGFVMWGNAAWIRCYVPESYGSGTIRVAVENINAHAGPIEHVQTSLFIDHFDCGEWLATCQVRTQTVDRFLSQKIEVRGGMCDGGHATPAPESSTYDPRSDRRHP